LEAHPQIINDLVLIAYAIGRIDEGLRYFERSYREGQLSKLIFDLSPIWQDVRADKRVYGVMDRLKNQS